MIWFSQISSENADDDLFPELPMRTHGCGICAASAAVYKLFGNIVNPRDIRLTMNARAGYDWIDDKGILWEKFIPALSKTFPPIHIEQMLDTNAALEALRNGCVLLASGEGNVFKTMDGKLHSHVGHVICFHDIDENGNVHAMDSAACGGADVIYTPIDFERFMEMVRKRTGRAAGSCYALSV